TGLRVPGIERVSEIESSSRLATENGALYLNAPMIYRGDTKEPLVTPVGFVVSDKLVITVRFEDVGTFAAFRDKVTKAPPTGHYAGVDVFVGILEVAIDRMADLLERLAHELDIVSHRIFRAEADRSLGNRHRPARESASLRQLLRRVGAAGDLLSKLRDSLLGMARMVPYANNGAAAWLGDPLKRRVGILGTDIGSLSDHANFMTNKVQLLLDATLGLINIEQNNIIKVLTIVSVMGIPPTLIASMYGMNFKGMPELTWSFGYYYGLAVIFLSAVLPLLWFKLRGWI
ncbi:MAG: magnesium transporter CorA family protein, partial [Stellaceae bacterium]